MSVFATLFQPGAIGSGLGIPPFTPFNLQTPGALAEMAKMAAQALPGPAGQLLNPALQMAQSLAAGGPQAGAASALNAGMAQAASALGNAVPGMQAASGLLQGGMAQAASALGNTLPGMAGGESGALPGNLPTSADLDAVAQRFAPAGQNALSSLQGMMPGSATTTGPAGQAASALATKAMAGELPKADDLLAAAPATGNQKIDQAVSVARTLRQPG
ncbi:hypothetical protein GE253_13100 [Niveispirillum sp. SYP-B3756]|uniref:hypothetical protein n=1 Tax=Niveispirillum sp. SYP-B3756 TaxID=2662178 RepID=UPI001290EDBA|nr:hypothetical protein [Niveispirillum sp. SYP-B3756]MQP66278.1 hypothetical protein [Niveispirillum sp. SYP-B3756]